MTLPPDKITATNIGEPRRPVLSSTLNPMAQKPSDRRGDLTLVFHDV